METLMIIDDEQYSHDFFIEMLKDLDCEVISAYDGNDALTKLRANKPDLIIMDKPVFSNIDFKIRGSGDLFSQRIKDIPVIISGDFFIQVILVQTFLTKKAQGIDH